MPPTLSLPVSLPLSIPPSLGLALAAVAGVGLDRLLGEAARWHPLVGFGKLAAGIEGASNRGGPLGRLKGLAAWALAVLPWVLLAAWLAALPGVGGLVDALFLYLALGGRSLAEHAARVSKDLAAGDLAAARTHVGWMVSRDTRELDEAGVAKACVESTLENGNDALFGALFWFALFGAPGVVLFRLANTLDAMWGYRTPRFRDFGWAAARIDDVLNLVPARLTALSYAVCGRTRQAIACWRAQAPAWDSPNAGPVMAAGAGSLGLTLGGAAIYHGRLEDRPPLGAGRPAEARDIGRALALVRHSLWLWLAVIVAGGLAHA